MRRTLRTAALAGALLLGAACGTDDESTEAGTGDGAPGTESPAETPPESAPGGAEGGPGETAPPAGDEGSPGEQIRTAVPDPALVPGAPLAVDSVVLVTPTAIELRFYTGVEPCVGLQSVAVEDTPDAVRVTVLPGTDPAEADTACIALAELVATTVELPAPLDGRPVLDASTGAEVPVAG